MAAKLWWMEDLHAGKLMEQIIIKSKIKDFKVYFSNDLDFVDRLIYLPHSVVVVGENVYKLYKNKIFDKFERKNIIVLPLSEENKCFEIVTYLYDKLLKFPAKKNLTLISFGGGTNQDVTGFVASTLYRGINWIYVPTTLLAQADSAIGLKTSLNLQSYKNVIGTFYPPTEIYINPAFLSTLKSIDFYSGTGEVVKLQLSRKNAFSHLNNIKDKVGKLLASYNHKSDKALILFKNLIKESIKIKLSYMEGDEFDRGRRNLLNYGHDLGHALESSCSFAVPHGTAVVIGMIFANIASYGRGLLSRETKDFIEEKILLPCMPVDLKLKKEYFSLSCILENIKKDKKRTGKKLVLIVPKKNLELTKVLDYDVGELKRDLELLQSVLSIRY